MQGCFNIHWITMPGARAPTRGASGEHVARCLQVNRAQTRMIARAAIHLRRLGDGLLDGVRSC